ncbi:histidine kinase [Seonamhaeicola sp. MEBiC1930]|uniref:sensor histidine kinase n=1 Tax=Seonamhaeicola sp. MEBiC01930 TaxID=2976768 RepID=UPI00324B04B2
MKIKYVILFLFFHVSTILFGQGVSVLPSHLPDYIYGVWVNDKNEVSLIISQDYIVISNDLYGYNDIVKENDRLDFTCVHYNNNVKYISTSKTNASNIILDEGFRVTELTKLVSNGLNQIPKALLGNWYTQKNKIELKENEVLLFDNSYKIDYVISTNKLNYHIVIYFAGEYNLLHNAINDTGHYLYANFLKTFVFKKATFYQKYKLATWSVLIVFVLLLTLGLINWSISTTRQREVTKRLLVEMQLKSFRSQMNPHFVFNALSAIQNLINKEDNEKANHYLTEFSQLMRLTLDKTEKGLVPLSDEITSIKKYLEIEKLRFPFSYKIFVDSSVNKNDIEIPAMLVQPFVENAIIHGLKEKQGDKNLIVEFNVKDENFVCLVKDNGIGINSAKKKQGNDLGREKYGVKLAKDRIALINENYKTKAQINITDISDKSKNETGTLVEIVMPLYY